MGFNKDEDVIDQAVKLYNPFNFKYPEFKEDKAMIKGTIEEAS